MIALVARQGGADLSAATPGIAIVVTLRERPGKPSEPAWSQDGHKRSCDLVAKGGIPCQGDVKKARSATVDAAGCHQTVWAQSGYGSGGRGFESLPARSNHQNSGVFIYAWSQIGHERAPTTEPLIQRTTFPEPRSVAKRANTPPSLQARRWDRRGRKVSPETHPRQTRST
jgi:hypothetical protein